MTPSAALREAAAAVLAEPHLTVLAGYGAEELAARHPRVVLEAVAASATCRAGLSTSPEFMGLLPDGDTSAWRRLLGEDGAERRGAIATLVGVPAEGPRPESDSARLREQVASLRRRVDD